MTPKKTLLERERELQAMIGTPEGQAQLKSLESRYVAASGVTRPPRTSLITFLLVHERQLGLIHG